MKKVIILKLILVCCISFISMSVSAQFNLKRALNGAVKATQAATLTDEQVREYVKEYIDKMDELNPVLPEDNPYTQRLRKLTQGITHVEGVPLNFKVYDVIDVNAFACADGSIRVFSSLMDIMCDEELLGVIGHEIGHIAHKDSKKSFRRALLSSALKDGISSSSSKAARLTDSQIAQLGSALMSASYSKSQERDADDYGYEFLKASGKNPWAMALSFYRLKEIQNGAAAKSNVINQLFSSHPDLDARIKRMEERAKADGFVKPEVPDVKASVEK